MDGFDQLAIQTLLARYNMAGDSGRIEEVATLFTADAVLETPLWCAQGPAEIIAALGSGASMGERRPRFVRHNITTSTIQMVDMASASGRTYFMVVTDIGLDHCGLYMDRFARIDGNWLITHRQVWIDWKSDQSFFERQRLGRPPRLAS